MTPRLSIRSLIPLMLLAYAAMMAIGTYFLMQAIGERHIEIRAQKELRHLMDVLQGSINISLRKNDVDAVRSQLTSLATDEQVSAALLVDDTGTIVSAGRRERIGQPLTEVLPLISRESTAAIIRSNAGDIALDKTGQTLLAVYPAYLPTETNRLRPAGMGLIIIEKSLLTEKAMELRHIEHHVAIFALFAATLAGLLWLTIHAMITRRLNKVIATTSMIASGKLTARVEMQGVDELAKLGNAVDDMAKSLAAQQHQILSSELRLRMSQDFANIGTWEWDANSGELFWSKTMNKLYGRKPGARAPGFNDFLHMVYAEDREAVRRGIEAALNQQQPYDMQHRIVQPDGTVRWLHTQGNVVQDTDSQALHLLGITRDVTEQKLAELHLRHTLEELEFQKYALDQHAIVATTDAAGKITYVNDKFCNISQYKAEELIGQNHSLINSGIHPRAFFEGLWKTVRSGKTWQGNVCNRKRNGDLYWVNTTIVPHINKQGKPDQYIAIRTEITQQKRTEEALKQSMSQFRAIFEEAAIGMAVFEMDHRIKIANYALQKMLGYTLGELHESPPQSLIYEQDEDTHDPHYAELIQGKCQSYRFEKHFKHKNGNSVWGNVTVSLVKSAQGDPLLIISMIEDITERRQLQLQLQQSQKMQTMGLLAGGIAHDFNNLLLSIMGYTELAKEKYATDEDGKLAQYLGRVLKASERARDIIAQLLAFSRSSELEFKPLQLKPLVGETIKMLKSVLPSSIKLHADIQASLPEVMADPTKLFQVLMNLCINARDAVRDCGEINILLQQVQLDHALCQSCLETFSGDYIELAVCDNGQGIDPEILDKIFDPFFTTKEVGAGTGMGLSMVHGIVHEHGGHIHVDNHLPQGTAVKLLLPIAMQQRVEIPQDASPPVYRADVLVVDAEESVARLIADVLSQMNLHVHIAGDSHQALRQFEREPDKFDLIITGYIIPGFSGRRLARKIWRQRPQLPIILCAADNDGIGKQEILQSGFQGYLFKPFSMQELVALVERLLPGNNPNEVSRHNGHGSGG